MALIVQKYGGTSVGSVERVRAVAKHIATFKENGHDLIITVSDTGIGMSKEGVENLFNSSHTN